ncbi:MAG: NfeD family protein [Actinomycetota bacterium]
MRRLAIGVAAVAAALFLLAAPTPAGASDSDRPASAQENDDGSLDDTDGADAADRADTGTIDVLQVSGFFDDIIIDAIDDAIATSAAEGSDALILQVNSRGTVVSDDVIRDLIDRVATADVPVAIWVGPNGARMYGTAAQLLAVADATGMAPGTRIGFAGVPLDDRVDWSGAAQDNIRNGSVGLSEARALGLVTEINDEGVPTITNMVQVLDELEVDGRVLDTTAEVVTETGQVRRDTTAVVRFSKLGLVDQLFHTVASPPVAYLLLLTGLALLVFEFFTAGVGVAGVTGAVCTVLATSGLAVLPTRTWAVVLILLAMVAFAIDVQVGLPRFWTGVGLGLTVVGSLFLFESLPGASLRPSWLALIAGIGGIALTFIVGMPNMVRTRFATPTVGREWMIGEEGTVVSDVDPDGIVEVGEGRWRARTNRATPVMTGDTIRVVEIDGVTLEVEPLEGAARDHRERRREPAE